MTLEEMEDTLIIIFIAETDPDSVYQISSDVQKQFHQARNRQKTPKICSKYFYDVLTPSILSLG